jgi:hypothetical protein
MEAVRSSETSAIQSTSTQWHGPTAGPNQTCVCIKSFILMYTLARSMLTYGSEAWTVRKRDEQRLTTAEMKFMRRTAGYSHEKHAHFR